jgi:TolB-like protein
VLWGTSTFDSGQQSLRRAIADIKSVLGPDFEHFLTTTHTELTLNLQNVHFLGRPGGGTFLEGLNVPEAGFQEWQQGIRQNPSQLFGLFSATHQPPPRSLLPMVAVIPFRMITGHAAQDTLGDWVAEEICRSLSRSNLMSVISHLSARRLDAQAVDIEAVRTVLGANYCMTGSFRIMGETAILDADFIDVANGRILVTRTFQAKLADFMAADSTAIRELTNIVGRAIATDTMHHVRGRDLNDLEDHRLLLAGIGMMHELRLSSFAQSRQLIEAAATRAPHAAEPLAWLGDWYVMSIWNGWSSAPQKDTQLAREYTQRALDLEPDNALCLAIDGVVHSALENDQSTAEAQFNLSLEHNPNNAMSWLFSGVMHAFRDEGDIAVERVTKAQSLSPIDPLGYLYHSFASYAHVATGDYGRAIELADRSLALNSRHISTLRTKICAHYHLDEHDKMHAAAQQLRDQLPDFNLDDYRRTHPASNFDVGDRMARALRASGF